MNKDRKGNRKKMECGTLLTQEDSESSISHLEDVERSYILRVLGKFHGQRGKTAQALGIAPRTLTYKLKRYREQGHDVVPALRKPQFAEC